MPEVTFVEHNGNEIRLDVEVGISLMMAATRAGVAGIIGDCGGNLSCATCHVHVDPSQVGLLNPPGDHERDMLQYTETPSDETSRLCCQITMAEALDGLRLHVAGS